MKLHFNLLIGYALLFLIFTSCNNDKNSITMVPDSQNQWPMSGGPDGSWKVDTDLSVPTKWSVRTGEHIKWKIELPEGGQSGIAVWGNKLFLTINPPNDNPKHSEVLKQYYVTKTNYDKAFYSEEQRLNQKNNTEYVKLKKALKVHEEEWQDLLAKNNYYQKASELEKPNIAKNLMRKNELGKIYSKILNEFKSYVHENSEWLSKLNKELITLEKAKSGGATSKDIVLICLNSDTGEMLWKQTVKGTISSQYNYGFSDATTPCPITDGKNVWAINASGGMACFTMEGNLVWERTWMPSTGGKPFNKQFDSVLYDDLILNTEPPVEGDTKRHQDWNYLHAFNKSTGKRKWVTEEALTHYNTPVLGKTFEGKPAILIGRGGPHEVPERPVGLSLISLDKEHQGSSIWNWEPKDANKISGWGALSTQHWDTEKASWFYKGDEHLTIDTKTGTLISKQKLNTVEQYNFNVDTNSYVLSSEVELKHHQNQRHCNMSSGDYLFYMVRYKPYIARHNIKTGKNEHLEIPTEIDKNGNYLWKTKEHNDGLNSQGQLNAFDARTRGDGFQKCFLGSPTMVNNYIYFTNALGLVYVIDANVDKFDESVLIAVNDLGERGQTWSVNSLSYSNGKIYHRTMKELICIGD